MTAGLTFSLFLSFTKLIQSVLNTQFLFLDNCTLSCVFAFATTIIIIVKYFCLLLNSTMCHLIDLSYLAIVVDVVDGTTITTSGQQASAAAQGPEDPSPEEESKVPNRNDIYTTKKTRAAAKHRPSQTVSEVDDDEEEEEVLEGACVGSEDEDDDMDEDDDDEDEDEESSVTASKAKGAKSTAVGAG